jgi:1-acyl-sn-glycerol-3-phosphate acyltransferase
MDPILIAASIDRKVSFLAKGSIFNNKLVAKILPHLGLIPIHRQQDDPSQLGKNTNTFKKSFEHLEKGGAILIFPEGISNSSQRKLQPIKSGAARIAIGAEQRNNNTLGVNISIIGLNYENQHKFNQDVLINIEAPLKVSEYINKFDNPADEITETIIKKLEANTISIENKTHDELARKIEMLMQQEKDERSFTANYELTHNIANAINYFDKLEPKRINQISSKIEQYFLKLKEIGVEDVVVNRKNLELNTMRFLLLFKLLIGLPFYLLGLINNFLPYEIPAYVANKLKDKDLRGSVAMVLGIFTFLIFYSIQICLIQLWFKSLIITLIYSFSIAPLGFFAYYYWYACIEVKMRFTLIIHSYRNSEVVSNILKARLEIIDELNDCKNIFLEKSVLNK